MPPTSLNEQAETDLHFVAQCGHKEWCIAIKDEDENIGCSRISEETFLSLPEAETAFTNGAWTPA